MFNKDLKLGFVCGLITGSLVIGGSFFIQGPTQAEKPVQEIEYTVKGGETLWEIVSRIENPDEKEDVRELIYEVIQRNHLNPNEPLQAGQILILKKK